MKRLIYQNLLRWRHTPTRLPLLLRGARRVGKTYLVRQLGKTFPQLVEINLEAMPAFKKLFEQVLEPAQLIKEISIVLGVTIIPGETLLFIDAWQDSSLISNLLHSLRNLNQQFPDLHVIVASTLLQFPQEKMDTPCDGVESLYLYPLTFIEYLCARGYQSLAEEILSHHSSDAMSDPIHVKAFELLGEYMAIGGMPEVIAEWISTQHYLSCKKILREINQCYLQDFAKYAKRKQIKYLELIFKNIPRLMGQSFKYAQLGSDYKKRELAPALKLLQNAGMVHAVYGLMLDDESTVQINKNKFKLILLDVGMSQLLLERDEKDWFINPIKKLEIEGQLAEHFVGQECVAYANNQSRQPLYFWSREAIGSHAEMDYVIHDQQRIIPVIVQSGHRAGLQSMRVFLKSNHRSLYGVRCSTENFSINGGIHTYPLYAVAALVGDSEKLLEFVRSASD